MSWRCLGLSIPSPPPAPASGANRRLFHLKRPRRVYLRVKRLQHRSAPAQGRPMSRLVSPWTSGTSGEVARQQNPPRDRRQISLSFHTGARNVGVDEPQHVLQIVAAVAVAKKSLSEFPHFFQALESIVEVTQLCALVQMVRPPVRCMS